MSFYAAGGKGALQAQLPLHPSPHVQSQGVGAVASRWNLNGLARSLDDGHEAAAAAR